MLLNNSFEAKYEALAEAAQIEKLQQKADALGTRVQQLKTEL